MTKTTKLGPLGLSVPARQASAGSGLTPGLYTDFEAFYSPTVVPGSVTTAPALVALDDAVYSTSISIANNLAPSLLASDDAFYSSTVAATDALSVSLVADTDTFFSPTITTAGSVVPPLFSDTDALYVPVVQRGSIELDPGLVASDDAFWSPTAQSTSQLRPSFVALDDAFWSPDTFNAVSLLPGLVVNDDVVPAPSVEQRHVVQPSLVVADAIIYVPVDASIYALLDTLYVDDDTFYSPIETSGPVGVNPPLYADADILYTATVQRQSTQGGGGGGNNSLPANVKYATQFTVASAGLITALQVQSNNSYPLAQTRMLLYADSGSLPGAQIASSTVKTGFVAGTNTYQLTVPHSVLAGDKVWAAIHTNTSINILGNTKSGARYNTDLFSDGASDPFGVSSLDNKKAPVLLVQLSAVNATMLPGLLPDADVFYQSSISKTSFTVDDVLLDQDFFYSPVVVDVAQVLPSIFSDDVVTYSPTIVPGATALLPSLFADADATGSPNMATFSPTLFPSLVVSGDVIDGDVVTSEGAEFLPSIISDADALHLPTVTDVVPLVPGLLGADDATYDPALAPGPVAALPRHMTDVDQCWGAAVAVVGGTATVEAAEVAADDFLWPTALGGPHRAHRVALSGLSAPGIALSGNASATAALKGQSRPGVGLRGEAGGAAVTIEGDTSAVRLELEGNDA